MYLDYIIIIYIFIIIIIIKGAMLLLNIFVCSLLCIRNLLGSSC